MTSKNIQISHVNKNSRIVTLKVKHHSSAINKTNTIHHIDNFINDYTVDEWADQWFFGHCNYISATTKESYKYTLRIIKDYFKGVPINNVKAVHIEELLLKLRNEDYSDSLIGKVRSMLFQIFQKAEANEILIKRNPVQLADKMRKVGPKHKKDAFTSEEIQKIFAGLAEDTRINMSIKLMLSTGMRAQELLALEPHHIAEDGSSIKIEQAVNVIEKGICIVGKPKSEKSYRIIPVPKSIQPYAVKLRENTHGKFIWYSPQNKNAVINVSTFRKQFQKALKKLDGVRALTPHCCRHTYVSQLQALGVDIQTIQSLVGHADINMTEHYLHVQESVKIRAINTFDSAFSTHISHSSSQ